MKFEIFEKKEAKKVKIETILTIIFLVNLFAFLSNYKMLENKLVEKVTALIMLGIFLIYAVVLLFRYETNQSLNGKIIGKLILNKNSIEIANREILVEEVKKIKFWLIDYESKPWRGGTINPLLLGYYYSNGADNFIEITYSHGKKERFNFIIKNENDFLRVENELIKYHKKGKIAFLELIEYLKIEKYEDIQEFKKTIANNG